MDDEGLEMGNERDDERELWERHKKAAAELHRIRLELEGKTEEA